MRTGEMKQLIVETIYELSKRDPKPSINTGLIAEETGLEPDAVNLCIEAMERNGHLTGQKMFGGSWVIGTLAAQVVLDLMDAG